MMGTMTEEREVPPQITLTADTVAALAADPDLAAELNRVRDEEGRAAMLDWLDEHGLRWRAGGSDPAAAFADAASLGGLSFGGPMFEHHHHDERPPGREQARRKAARKAQRNARKAGRRK